MDSSQPPPAPVEQSQFLDVCSRDEAERRFRARLDLQPCGCECVTLDCALGRVLAEDLHAAIDVPGFDRANVDGYAVCSGDLRGAMEETPRVLRVLPGVQTPGPPGSFVVQPGEAAAIATGAVVPRGADAVVMVEHTDLDVPSGTLSVRRGISPGQNITFAGADVARGETVLRRGTRLTSRELGVAAALGCETLSVLRRPRVAILSTGNEIVPPGEPLPVGCVYDSNAAILAAAVVELGGEPVPLGVIPDDEARLTEAFRRALAPDIDAVLLSGGTSKGTGDLSYRVLARLTDPGIVVHGVALKPGKPLCLAVDCGRPVVILPGFPTSAIFTFHEFVAPVLRTLAGLPAEDPETVAAVVPQRINSERGRTEYLLVNLLDGPAGLSAYPLGKGSGSVTAFSLADGFVAIPQHTEMLDEGTPVVVHRLGRAVRPAGLVVIGSHCVGLEALLGLVIRRGVSAKTFWVGSQGGLSAARRGECDLAGVHLLDPATGVYNRPFITPDLELVPGYRRLQGILFRPDDPRFADRTLEQVRDVVASDPACTMVNRNPGSGTRILSDRWLAGATPAGYLVQPKSHNAVAAAVAQGRADWGVAIETVARLYGLGFLPLQDEGYDFVIPRSRADRPGVREFRAILNSDEAGKCLAELGFRREVDDRP